MASSGGYGTRSDSGPAGSFLVSTPLTPLAVTVEGEALTEIRFRGRATRGPMTPAERRVAGELLEYFAGRRKEFGMDLAPAGTAFQQSVWRALCRIPYGATRTYGEIAKALGKPGAARAVGTANHYNPIPIVIPCHRVIGSDGRLCGFGGGLALKRRLLELEASHTPLELSSAR